MDWRAFAATAALAVFLVLAGTGGAVPNARLTVSDVTVSPGEPTVSEPVTITPTVASSVGSDEPVEITRVNATVNGTEIGAKSNIGTLSPGDDVSVPFTATFDEPGTYTVEFTFVGIDDQGERVTVTRTETVTVSPVPAVRLTVDDVAVEPATPTAGAPVTVPITVGSSTGSTQPVEIDAVELRAGAETLASATELGALSPGGSITVPLTTTFQRPGEKRLTARLVGTNADDEPVVVTRPVRFAVESGAPAVELNNRSATEATTSTLSMTVSNPTEGPLRNIVATIESAGLEEIVDRRVIPTLAAGAQANVEFTVRPETAGEALLRTNLSYTTAAGTAARAERSAVLSVAPLEEDVSVRVETQGSQQDQQNQNLGSGVGGILDANTQQQEQTDEPGGVEVVVSNLGNAPIRNVVLHPRAGNRSLGARPVTDELAPGAETSVSVSLARTPPTELVFETSYDVGTNRSTATAAFDPAGSRGAVSVTGVNIEPGDGRVQITGDIGNPGGSPVSGVVVAVDSGNGVEPVYPNRDFFVGEIDENAFAPFELTAAVEENATSIPLTVTYLVDGDRRTEQVTLPLEGRVTDESSGDPPALLVGGVVAALVSILILIVVLTRRA
ncbi:hypothetical protein GRX03_14400 [Halovenus sp. WSH3]|uniref:CARDB domain-containing protein n=1 Tax=Halovenus carboxidivorans TaxID=2692199 RepID=A0A6B0TC40_9EURY|nr:hypothetical protein [Halovenus carboxidivorans]MXR52791.1 hypothetical protein [Halovenus carboxidivorans]